MTNLYKIIPLFFKVKKYYIRFLNEFDSYFLTHHLEKDSLKAYESKLEDIYSYFEKAYSHGINDNTLKPLDNLKEYYNTLNHALMALLQKITNKVLWLFAIGQLGWSILSCIISSWLVFYYTDAEGVLYKYIILKW